MARIYSYFASQLDFLKNDIIKVLALNAEGKLDLEEFAHLYYKLQDTMEMLEEKAELKDFFSHYKKK